MVNAAVMTTIAFIIEALTLFLTIRYPNSVENTRDDDATREAVDAGRKCHEHRYDADNKKNPIRDWLTSVCFCEHGLILFPTTYTKAQHNTSILASLEDSEPHL
ncbi:hypothetical protein Lal_00010921 [Lupinus albus]|nr:hypothetical protein Lal_00010921 [Lupinus albus]